MIVVTPEWNELRSYAVPSIFLAGPSHRVHPRLWKTKTHWREEAIGFLERANFQGEVFVPEPYYRSKGEQFAWEEYYLNLATVIAFWIPRDLVDLPGFTTNVEFGEWYKSGKVVLGLPPEAQKVSYLRWKAERHGVQVYDSLFDTLGAALDMTKQWKRR